VRLGWQDEEQQGRCTPMHGRRAFIGGCRRLMYWDST
jgi:hypothetical protein